MKVTAQIPDKTINEVMRMTGGKNITDALKIALKDYIRAESIKELSNRIKNNPLKFEMSAEEIRKLSNG